MSLSTKENLIISAKTNFLIKFIYFLTVYDLRDEKANLKKDDEAYEL